MKKNKLTASFVKAVLHQMECLYASEIRVGRFQFVVTGDQYGVTYKNRATEVTIVEKDPKKFIDRIKNSELYGLPLVDQEV